MPITYRSQKTNTSRYTQNKTLWPTLTGATSVRAAGIVLIVVHIINIIWTTTPLLQEEKHDGHSNIYNKKPRKTIIIHGLQLSLLLLPLLITAVGRHHENTILQPFLLCYLHCVLTLWFMVSETKSCKPSHSRGKDLVQLLTTWQTLTTQQLFSWLS